LDGPQARARSAQRVGDRLERRPVVDSVTHTYPSGVQALKGVSLRIPAGMFGLLGPNGAGKSTLMRIVATLQEPDGGAIALGDLDVLKDRAAVRRVLGYQPQEFGVYPKVSALELLDHFAVLKGLIPRRAGIDPFNTLIDRNPDDNLVPTTLVESPPGPPACGSH
jgi:ABC-type multidrug transport system ATPase subunit